MKAPEVDGYRLSEEHELTFEEVGLRLAKELVTKTGIPASQWIVELEIDPKPRIVAFGYVPTSEEEE